MITQPHTIMPAGLADTRLLSGTRVEIDLAALRHNVQIVHDHVKPANIMAMIKANAYGHGLDIVASVLAEAGIDAFGVAHLAEALLIRGMGIRRPVLVLWPLFPDEMPLAVQADLDVTVVDEAIARQLSEAAQAQGKTLRVHFKIDTGMGRLGMDYRQAPDIIERCSALPGLESVGVYSHFAMVGRPEHEFTRVQLAQFKEAVEDVQSRGIDIPWRHIASTGAVEAIPDSWFSMVRLGIGLFGHHAMAHPGDDFPVKPVMSFHSRVRQVRQLQPGDSVSYGRTYRVTKPTTIAAVSVGYSDGYRRAFSNKAPVLINGVRHRIAGTVCMDWIMVEIQDDAPVAVGDDVVLFGSQGDETVTVTELCQMAKTIPYDLLCGVRDTVPRIAVNG